MCTISTTQLHCPNVSSYPRHNGKTDSNPSVFPKMVMSVALLMCKEVLWSWYSVTHKQEEYAVNNIEETVHLYKRIDLRLHHWGNYLPTSAVWSTQWTCMIVVSATCFRLHCSHFEQLRDVGRPGGQDVLHADMPQRDDNGCLGALNNQSSHSPLPSCYNILQVDRTWGIKGKCK